jgi:hypothetical protein
MIQLVQIINFINLDKNISARNIFVAFLLVHFILFEHRINSHGMDWASLKILEMKKNLSSSSLLVQPEKPTLHSLSFFYLSLV